MSLDLKNYDSLTNSEKTFLHFVLDNKELVIRSTATKIANLCGVSKTVAINTCQKLGFDGFNDLRYYLKNSDTKESKSKAFEIKDVEAALFDMVEKTLSLNRPELMEKVADKILNAECIYIISRGTSKAIGSYFSHILLTLNIKCINIPDYNLLDIIARKMNHDEVLIAMSLSGETSILVQTCKTVKAYGNTLISITGFSNNTIASISDYQLFCSSGSLNTASNDTESRLGMMTVIDYLCALIKAKMNK
ncbi:MAG: MurR/RpiR family transcriptional regulator [Erysipelotrichaceae bacterium]|nr:MurR/RpiR family transcriptional regulator [Erysipelotrichaceae bacterium]